METESGETHHITSMCIMLRCLSVLSVCLSVCLSVWRTSWSLARLSTGYPSASRATDLHTHTHTERERESERGRTERDSAFTMCVCGECTGLPTEAQGSTPCLPFCADVRRARVGVHVGVAVGEGAGGLTLCCQDDDAHMTTANRYLPTHTHRERDE